MITLDFSKLHGLVPAIIQDFKTRDVLMLGFMNREAWQKTLDTGLVTFFSRTKKRLWTKGEESGNFLTVKEIVPDCDNDTLLILAEPSGPVCHTGNDTCFGQRRPGDIEFLQKLSALIHSRKTEMPENSYTTKLFSAGINKIAQKVGEEAVELVIEAKDDNRELFVNEAADLVYHLMVLLEAKGSNLGEVSQILEQRHG
jgi:phosphoribosyl-ATP pyrophosphohydrolase/phosphoribosyl-AMP cyclohydrolase